MTSRIVSHREVDASRTADASGWVSVRDAEAAARAALPPMYFDYIAGGAEDERTVRANEEAYARRRLRPRVLTDVSRIETATTLLGTSLAAPLIVAPSALHRMYHPDGEAGTYRAATRAGALMTASSAGSVPLEEVAMAATGPRWFQLYAFRERTVVTTLVQAAVDAGYLCSRAYRGCAGAWAAGARYAPRNDVAGRHPHGELRAALRQFAC